MTIPSSTLLPDWNKILAEIDQHLQTSVASADARLEQIPGSDSDQRGQERAQEAARLQACLQGLGAQLQAAEQLVQEVDHLLQAGEEVLRQQSTSCAQVRQKLATWAGRAIG